MQIGIGNAACLVVKALGADGINDVPDVFVGKGLFRETGEKGVTLGRSQRVGIEEDGRRQFAFADIPSLRGFPGQAGRGPKSSASSTIWKGHAQINP